MTRKTKEPPTKSSAASDYLRSRGRAAAEDTTAEGLPHPLAQSVFVTVLISVVLYPALRVLGFEILVAVFVTVVAAVILIPTLEAHYRGKR